MNNIMRYDKSDFADMVSLTAREMGLREAVIEKDFWVCAVLDYLFHRCKWRDAFTFKGGTSLSKVYDLIKRFSEDIDIILDWRVIGYDIYVLSASEIEAARILYNEESERFSADFAQKLDSYDIEG